MKQIKLEQVSRHYGRHFALHRVSTQIKAGEITALMGANGAGKTTLLNILAGIEEPSTGEVLYDRWSWKQFAKHGRHLVGWVSHSALLYMDLTGRENLHFYANMYGIEDAAARCEKWLDLVGLTGSADRRAEVYSRGMVQRLTIARALLHEPDLLLLDEPLTGLDREARAQMGELFKAQREQGKIVILSTHDLHTLAMICDRMLILRKGQLLHDAAPSTKHELIDTYERFA